jgi:stage II sporulation protein R
MKKVKKIIVLFVIFIAAVCIMSEVEYSEAKGIEEKGIAQEDLQTSLAQKIIRFHVIADSDTDASQQLKLKVKDETLGYMKTLLSGSEDIDTTREIIRENLCNIENFALEVVKREGYEYNVSAELETCYFPIKEYGSLSFPAGYYEALRIKIGKAEGRNWWCVMYPNLCFVDGTYAVVSDETKKTLEKMLTKDEYNMLLDGSKTKISFKYLGYIEKLINKAI